ncbi:MAG TPA: hypothetical protein ENG55_02485, partial [Candidatus Omnitrophica bacterium]|nr:hypothetical protein [Candidatus Omnitrophota bacterium]
MKSKKIIIAAVLIAAISGLLFCPQIRQAIADFSFLHTDWSGGASSDTAVHPDNQTGWQNYSSKESNVDTSFPGKVTMSKLEGEIIDDTDADFAKGTLDNLQIVGTGTGAKVEVIANVEDLFCDSIGHWVNQYHMPAFDYGATFTRVTDYPNAGDDYIYAFFSNWSARTVFGRFNVTTNNWTFLADFPKAISPGWGQGASLCYPGSGDYIYALRGSYTKDFYRYSITNDTWEKLRDIPEAVWTGGSLAARDSTAIFAIVRKESSDFYMYDTSGDVWIQKADTPWSVGESGNIVYPGSGDYIYLMRGWGGYCARYHIDFNTWSSIASSFSVTYGASFVYPGQGDYIYATSGVDRTNFARFSITAQSWESLSSLPVKQSRWRPYFYYTVDGTEPKINMLLANYTRPLKFDLTNLRWDEPCSPPDTPNWSGRMAWDGGDYIYYIRGSGSKVFYRYSISNNKWERLANSILYYGNGGGGITYYNGKIYSWEGGNRSGFAEYDPATDTWTSLANTPSTMYWGCVMQGAQDAGEDYIYALRGNKTSTFWRYKISTNTWEAMADVPGSVWEGGCLLYPGTGDYMYATRGYSSTDFYRYSISNNTWEALANVDGPKRNGIRSQDTLVYSATTPDYIYWMRSTSQGWSYSPLDMARYSISNDTWERLDDKPFPGISVYAATDNYIYAVSNWQGGLWRYDLATQKWTDPAEATEALYGGIYGGNNMVYVGGDYAYLVGAYGGDYPRSWYRYIWKYKISEDRYEKMIEIPFHTGYSTKAVYPGSGNFIYILQGMGTKHLWRFDVVNETFTQLADAPVRIGWGASFGGSGDRLFAVRGDNTQTFMQYTISTNTWQILTDTPSSIESRPSQNSLVYPGGDYVYLHRGGGSGTFWAYNITTASWFNLAG